MDTDFDEVVRKRKDTLDGLLSKFELEGGTEEVKLTAEGKLLLREACKKSWSDRTLQFEAVSITSGSRLQARLEDTAADVVLFQEHRWTAPRQPEQRSRIRKKEWDMTLSPASQSERSENASNSGGTGIACRAGINATDVRSWAEAWTLPWSGSRSAECCLCYPVTRSFIVCHPLTLQA